MLEFAQCQGYSSPHIANICAIIQATQITEKKAENCRIMLQVNQPGNDTSKGSSHQIRRA